MKRLESSIGEQSGSVFASILTGFLLCAHRLSTPSRMLSFLERVLIPKCTPFLNIQLSFHSPPQARTNIGGGLQGRGASDTPHARGKKRERESGGRLSLSFAELAGCAWLWFGRCVLGGRVYELSRGQHAMSLNPGKGPSDLSDANLEGVGPRARGPPGLRTSQASKQEREREDCACSSCP